MWDWSPLLISALDLLPEISIQYPLESFKGFNKYVAFAVAGAAYEAYIAQLKEQSPGKSMSSSNK